jgi:hypothetical protein
MKRYFHVFLCCTITIILTGCASLNGNGPFQYPNSLVTFQSPVDKIVGMKLLTDNRPEADKENTIRISDVPEKISARLLADINSSKIYGDIHYPSRSGDMVIIEGSIDRFMWKYTPEPYAVIPLVNLILYFGVPSAHATGTAQITLEVKNAQSGKLLGKFTESASNTSTFTMYNRNAGESGGELADAFREVVKKLKEDLINKPSYQ